MKMNTLEKVRNCMRDLTPQVELAPEIIQRAKLPIQRMLEWSKA
jgi:quinolinate synthase